MSGLFTASVRGPDSLRTPGFLAGGGGWEDTRQLAPGKQDKEAERTRGSSAWLQAGDLVSQRDPLSTVRTRGPAVASGRLNSGGESQGETAQAQQQLKAFLKRPFLSWTWALDPSSLKNERCQHLTPERGPTRPDPEAWGHLGAGIPFFLLPASTVLELWAPPGGHEPNRNPSCDWLQAIL